MSTRIIHRLTLTAALTTLLLVMGACQRDAKVLSASTNDPQAGQRVAETEGASQRSAESAPSKAGDAPATESSTNEPDRVAQADAVQGTETKPDTAVQPEPASHTAPPAAVDAGSTTSESPAAEVTPVDPQPGESIVTETQTSSPNSKPADAARGGSQSAETSAAPAGRNPIPPEPVVSNPLLYDLHNNPSAQSDRGEPSIIDPMRPCVWVSLDGREGRMQPGRMQWLVEEPVSPRPTFTLRTVPQVLGEPVKLRLAVIRLEELPNARGMRADEKWLYFLESKQDGKVKAGIPYPLCSSSDLLTYTDRASSEGRIVDAMPNLPPGTYELIGDFVGTQTHGEKTLAVTRFTVKGD